MTSATQITTAIGPTLKVRAVLAVAVMKAARIWGAILWRTSRRFHRVMMDSGSQRRSRRRRSPLRARARIGIGSCEAVDLRANGAIFSVHKPRICIRGALLLGSCCWASISVRLPVLQSFQSQQATRQGGLREVVAGIPAQRRVLRNTTHCPCLDASNHSSAITFTKL